MNQCIVAMNDVCIYVVPQMWQCMAQYCGKSASAIDERMVRPQNETDLLDALYHVGPLR